MFIPRFSFQLAMKFGIHSPFGFSSKETMESLRDAISLVSDDYPITHNEQN